MQHVTADLYFAIVPEWLIDADISDRAFRLYATVARYANADGTGAFPSRRTLGKRLRCSVNTVDRALAELIDAGALVKEHRYGDDGQQTSNGYQVRRVPTDGAPPGPNGGAPPGPTDGAQTESHDDLEGERETRAEPGQLFQDPKPKRPRRKPERPIPDGWEPDDRLRAWAADNTPSVDVDLEAAKFVDHAISVDRRARDWPAAFRNWLRKAASFHVERGGRGRQPGPGRAYEGAEPTDPGYWVPEGATLLDDEEGDDG